MISIVHRNLTHGQYNFGSYSVFADKIIKWNTLAAKVNPSQKNNWSTDILYENIYPYFFEKIVLFLCLPGKTEMKVCMSPGVTDGVRWAVHDSSVVGSSDPYRDLNSSTGIFKQLANN